MSVQTPIGGSATDALEMRRQSLRRQIGVVAALIVVVAAALAAVHFLSPPSPVQDKGSDVAARDPATGGGTAPAGPAVALPAPVAPADATRTEATATGAKAEDSASTAPPPPVAPPQPAESAVPPTALPAIPTPAPTAAAGEAARLPAAAGTPLRSSIRFEGNGADRRHFVQLGSLLPPADAETLRARLQEQGLPTLLETRVRVGPFGTRDEALAAEARLRELGFAAAAPAAPGR